MKQLTRYLRENIKWLTVILCIAMTSSATMLLNGISFTEIGYGLLLCGFITVSVLFVGFYNHLGRFACLEQMKQNILVAPTGMKAPESMYEQQYQDCIRILAREKNLLQNEMADRQRGMSEYYSMWVHQIKTPIAALKLLTDEAMHLYLDAEEAERHNLYIVKEQQKQQELFRIEQYVDMALQYTRLGAETNDFVIQQVRLDDVIKPSIHKYARQFIHKQLRLSYTPQDITAVTDKKWLGFVIDQLLSNAVKYTKQGGVTIHAYDGHPSEHVGIVIEDTGIGISAQDLPRICEKGYTGYNGHADQYSSGIGLYLCKEILDKLGHPLALTSEIGAGTRVEIILPKPNLQ